MQNRTIVTSLTLMALIVSAPLQVLAATQPGPVGEAVLEVSCEAQTESLFAHEEVTWSASVSGGVAPFTYEWSGDNGLSGSGDSVTKSYSSAGTYAATLKVVSSDLQEVSISCGTVLVENAPVTPEPTSERRFGGSRVSTQSQGEVLGASTTEEEAKVVEVKECKPLITTHFKVGLVNDPENVKVLQHFLNGFFNTEIAENGIYDIATIQLVNKFQLVFADEILKPWVDAGLLPDISTPTGQVYITTARLINKMSCPEAEVGPLPALR